MVGYARLRPDVVLMDLQIPEVVGAKATRRIKLADPEARVLVLTTYAIDEFIFTRCGPAPATTYSRTPRPPSS